MLHNITRAKDAVRRVLQHGAIEKGTARIGHVSRIPEHIQHAIAHLEAAARGEAIDLASGELNLAHAATRCMIAIEALYQEAEKEQAKLPKMVRLNFTK
jgi:hypothetical protein